MMRKKIVAGNWKMHSSRDHTLTLLEEIKKGAQGLSADVVVFPPFVHLHHTEDLLKDTSIGWGGQNMYMGESGAFTGEISGPMLNDYGCQYVLIGHSERRQIFNESLELISAKFRSALQFGLIPILCIGETLEERKSNQTENIIEQQLASVLEAVSIDDFQRAVVAYEPVWAIGTGLTATPEQAQAAHAHIRKFLGGYSGEVAQSMRILYGGSVKADNAKGLFAMADIDGGLIGGASLEAKSFLAICKAAV